MYTINQLETCANALNAMIEKINPACEEDEDTAVEAFAIIWEKLSVLESELTWLGYPECRNDSFARLIHSYGICDKKITDQEWGMFAANSKEIPAPAGCTRRVCRVGNLRIEARNLQGFSAWLTISEAPVETIERIISAQRMASLASEVNALLGF